MLALEKRWSVENHSSELLFRKHKCSVRKIKEGVHEFETETILRANKVHENIHWKSSDVAEVREFA